MVGHRLKSLIASRFTIWILAIGCGLLVPFLLVFAFFEIYDQDFGDPPPTALTRIFAITSGLAPLMGIVAAKIFRRRGKPLQAVISISLAPFVAIFALMVAHDTLQPRIVVPSCQGSDAASNCSADRKYAAILLTHAGTAFGSSHCSTDLLAVPTTLREVSDNSQYYVYRGQCSYFETIRPDGTKVREETPLFTWEKISGGVQTIHVIQSDQAKEDLIDTQPSVLSEVRVRFEERPAVPQ